MASYHRVPSGASVVCVDDLAHLACEARPAEAFGVAADNVRVEPPPRQGRKRVGKRLGSRLRHEHAGHAVAHGFEGAPAGQCDHRAAAGLGLDRDDAEVFFARQHDGRGATIQVADLVVGLVAQKLDRRVGGMRRAGDRAPAPRRRCGGAGRRGGRRQSPGRFVCRAPGQTQSAGNLPGPVHPAGRTRCPRAGTRRPTDDYSIGGFGPQHNVK